MFDEIKTNILSTYLLEKLNSGRRVGILQVVITTINKVGTYNFL